MNSSKDIRIQLDRIAQIINRDFGVIDERENKIYYSGESNNAFNTITVPEELKNDIEDSDFLQKDGYSFFRYAGSDSTVYLYMKSGDNTENDRRLLELAALAYENKEQIQKSAVNHFYQSLLIDGPKSVNQSELTQYGIKGEHGYVVVNIYISSEDYISNSESSSITVLLKGIFSQFQTYKIVILNSQKYAVVFGINEEKDEYEQIIETSTTIRDTLASELMVDAYVSVGSLVARLTEISISYKDAETAREAGLVFGLDKECYVYDKMGIEKLIYGLPIRNCVSFLKETLGVEFLKDKNAKELLYTVKTFLYNNQNVSESARALYIHRNTLVYRLDKFNKLTNLDSTKFEEGMKIGIALMIMKYLEKKAPGEFKFER